MAGMRRLLMVLALLAPPGCIVGPQEELPDMNPDPGEARNDGDDAGAGADGDADIDDEYPPAADAEFPDDGDFSADGAGEGFDDADPSVEDLEGATVPGVPIPRPGMPSPRPDGPDLDAVGGFPPGAADLGTVDAPTDDDV